MSQDLGLLEDVQNLRKKIEAVELPDDLRLKINDMLNRLERSAKHGFYSEEYERTSHYIDWICNIPWFNRSQDQIDLDQAHQILNRHHYGLDSVKQKILEYLATIKLNINNLDNIASAPIVCLVGLAGTGKTTFAYALAEAMGRKIYRIPFGGMGSARDLRGQSRLHLEAEPGLIVRALVEAGTKNPVILLDEIDRVAAETRADIMGVLLALLDPGQNKAFLDHYIDYPLNLNEVLFIATANNTDNISTAVANRLEMIHLPTYSDEEKIIIAKTYLLPSALSEAGLPKDAITIEESLWPSIVRPLGFDSGIRVLKRAIDTLTRKVAFEFVKGQVTHVHITQDNVFQYFEQQYY